MTTRYFWILSVLFAVMVLVGLFTVNNTLIALALPLLAYMVVAVTLAPGGQKLKATRMISTDRITQGMDITIRIQVVNENEKIEELHLSELLPLDSQIIEGENSKVVMLNTGESLNYEYSLQCWRGNYRFEGLHAWSTDPFGMFEIQEELHAEGDVLVYPEVISLKAIPIRPPQTKGFSGPIPSRKSGTGMDFFGVRQYQLGDSLRRVNWKTSARHTVDLFTNEYEQERIADVGFILDARPHCDIPFQGQRLFEYSVQATASMAEMFLDEGHCLSLLIYSSPIKRVFPGYGKIQRERILRALADADTGVNYAMEHLRYFPTRLLPPRGQLIYISPLAADDLERLLYFRANGYNLLIISPDPLYPEQQNETETSQIDFQLAVRYAQIERDLLFRNLRRAGIQVVDWKVDQPLSMVLEKVRFQNMLYQRMVRLQS
ncbi:DUF58 domain-containing protein [Chloroflexota bacterium]